MGIRRITGIVTGVLGIVFGLMTLKSGGSVLFLGGAAREAAGSYVPFVLWFNFLAGFAYIGVGGLLLTQNRLGAPLGFVIAGSSILILGGLGLHIAMGGQYENRTVYAMVFRIIFWVSVSGAMLVVKRKFPAAE